MRRPSPETADADGATEAGASDAAAEVAGVAVVAEVAGVAEELGPEHATAMRANTASRVGHVASLLRASKSVEDGFGSESVFLRR